MCTSAGAGGSTGPNGSEVIVPGGKSSTLPASIQRAGVPATSWA